VDGQALDTTQVQALREAVALYHGDLFEGCFHDWCLYERERLQNLFLGALDKLMDYCEACGDYESGLAYGSRILQYDGARERTHRRLMRLYCLAGERSAAMRQYDHCVQALRRELDVTPSDRTLTLYQQVRKGHLRVVPRPPHSLSRPGGPVGSEWSELLEQLTRMQQDLAHLQVRLEDAIRRAEGGWIREMDRRELLG
jgi:hypothetical protein